MTAFNTAPNQTAPDHAGAPSARAEMALQSPEGLPPSAAPTVNAPKAPSRAPRKAATPTPNARATSPSKTVRRAQTKRAAPTVSQAATSKKVAKHPPEPLPKARPTAKSDGAAKKLSSKTAEKSIGSKKAPKPKEKLVRDSFTMPQEDYALIAGLKHRALMFKRPTKKSELLRAGLHALQALPAATLREALDSLTPLKVGRPKRGAP